MRYWRGTDCVYHVSTSFISCCSLLLLMSVVPNFHETKGNRVGLQTTGPMSFNRTQSRAVTGLLTGYVTLRRHFHLMGLINSPLRRRCGAEEVTSAYTLCECEAFASLRHVRLASFILEPGDVKSVSLGAVWNFSKGTGLPDYGA
jgi:hypothetical protein